MKVPDFLQPTASFTKNFSVNMLEGAALASVLTVGPHLFKHVVNPSYTPRLTETQAINYMAIGSLGWAAYKTIVNPLASSLHTALLSVPKQLATFAHNLAHPSKKESISSFSSGRVNPLDRHKKMLGITDSASLEVEIDKLRVDRLAHLKKYDKTTPSSSLYSLSFWSFGTLMLGLNIHRYCSEVEFINKNAFAPVILGTLGSLGLSYAINMGITYSATSVAEQDEKNLGIIDKTWKVGMNSLNLGARALKLGILGTAMAVAHGVKSQYMDPSLNNPLTQAVGTAFSWAQKGTAAVSDELRTWAFDPLVRLVAPIASYAFIESGYIDCNLTLDGLKENVCDYYSTNEEFINTWIDPVWKTISYPAKHAYHTLFFSTTHEMCKTAESFQEDNAVICHTATAVKHLYDKSVSSATWMGEMGIYTAQTVGKNVKGGAAMAFDAFSSITQTLFFEGTLEKYCQNQELIAQNQSLCDRAKLAESIYKGAAKNLGDTWSFISAQANNPNVQNRALAVIGVASALYGIHLVATKVHNYYSAQTEKLDEPDIEEAYVPPEPSAPPLPEGGRVVEMPEPEVHVETEPLPVAEPIVGPVSTTGLPELEVVSPESSRVEESRIDVEEPPKPNTSVLGRLSSAVSSAFSAIATSITSFVDSLYQLWNRWFVKNSH